MLAQRIGILCVVCLAILGTILGIDAALPEKRFQEGSVSEETIDSITRFSLEFWRGLEQERKEPNLFCSGLSAYIVLGMLLNGAHGDTYAELARAMNCEGKPLEEFNAVAANLMPLLQRRDPELLITTANALWVDRHVWVDKAYVRRLRSSFQAETARLDFDDPHRAADTINSWISKKTRGFLQNVLHPNHLVSNNPDDWTAMVLTNVLYFKGKWKTQFQPSDTRELPFYDDADHEIKRVPMMKLYSKVFPYLETPTFQAVVLPYIREDIGFYLFVPRKGQTLDALIQEVTVDNWKAWMQSFRGIELESVGLPRFELKPMTYDLKTVLEGMGVRQVFDREAANFKGTFTLPGYGEDMYVRHFMQQSKVKVDEEGTEAAVVTAVVGFISVSMNIIIRPKVIADRPFLFALVHRPTGLPLFIGTVREPQH